MDRPLREQSPRDPDLGFRWAMYVLIAAAMTTTFGPAVLDLSPSRLLIRDCLDCEEAQTLRRPLQLRV
jgi:hypothetical protein